MNYDGWLKLGERLQLSGEALVQFVQQKEDEFIEREERARRQEDERRMLEMQHEFQMKEQELKIQELKVQKREEESIGRALRPKLPKFDESSNDIDAYIERFERFAKGQGWSVNTWATSLSSLLTGKGLEVYTSMPPDEADDYAALKVAVLKRYQLTEEGFRIKFRGCKRDTGETVFQFVARLRRYLCRWIELAGADGTKELLMDLLLREQFIQSCSSEAAIFLKERAPKCIDEATRLAEQYVEAHGGKLSSNKGTSNVHQKGTESTDKQVPNLLEERQRTQRQGKMCYICGKVGHFARECRHRQNNHHTRSEKRIGAVCTHSELKQGPVADNTVQRMLKLENGDFLKLIAGSCTIETLEGSRNLDIKKGFVGTNKVKVLRDTGCELAAVRKELVDDDQFQEKQIVMVTIDGEAKVVPTARIKVDTPYYIGELEVMVPNTLICDLIIGNVPGVTDKPNPDWRESPEHTSVAAVMTRSQEKRSNQPMRSLEVAVPSIEKEIKPSELKEEQKKDTTLEKLWKFSQEGRERETKSEAEWRYEERVEDKYSGVAIIEAGEDTQIGAVDDESLPELPNVSGRETYRDVQVCDGLTPEQNRTPGRPRRKFGTIETDTCFRDY